MLAAIRPLLLLAAVTALPAALHADTYNFTISTAPANSTPGLVFVAAGTFTGGVDPFNTSALDITSITGSANGYNFLGVVDPGTTSSMTTGTSSGFTFDNVLYTTPGAPYTDANGFLLDLDSPAGVSLAHVFYTGITVANPFGYEVDVIDPNDPGAFTPFSIESFTISAAASAVPETSTIALLGTGILGLAGALRRRFAH
jgi:hypothetical protein